MGIRGLRTGGFFGIALASALVGLSGFACGQDNDNKSAAEKRWAWSAEALEPFWRGDVIQGESVLFIRDPETGVASAKLLFPVQEIVVASDSAGTKTFMAGRDFRVEPGSREIILPEGSSIPSFAPADLRRPAKSQAYELTHRDGNGEIFFGARLEYAAMQTCFTYRTTARDWPLPATHFDATRLPRTIGRLKAKQPVSLVVLGDSISAGANASAQLGGPPHQPAYPELVRLNLSKHYDAPVTLKNLSVGGRDTGWGTTQIDAVLEAKPDLVVIAFGMNDSAGRPADDYQAKTKAMIDAIRAARPETEFVLVATMLGNRDWIRLKSELFPAYREALQALAGPGIGVADVTSVWEKFLNRKLDWDQTGNGVNHPNDFGHRVYAQVVCDLLIPPQ